MKQKLGITLIAAWYALGGLMLLLLAVGTTSGPDHFGIPEELIAIGVGTLIVFAVIAFAIAYGVYNLEGWSWYAAIILSALSVVLALLQLNLFGLIIPGLIIWYLWENQKDFKVSINL